MVEETRLGALLAGARGAPVPTGRHWWRLLRDCELAQASAGLVARPQPGAGSPPATLVLDAALATADDIAPP